MWFSRIYDLAMAPVERHVLGARRRVVLAGVRGEVLELGAGTGANLRWYGPLTRLALEEPSAGMRARLRTKLSSAPRAFTVDLVGAPAESLPFPDGTFDAVIATLVLCSVTDLEKALREVRRVLKPGGTLHFIEHVRSQGAWGLLQDALTPAWRRVAANCHLNRRTLEVMTSSGFTVETLARDLPFVTGIARLQD